MEVDESVKIHKLDNGITLLGEEMENVSSASLTILVPIGAATDIEGQQGCASILSDMFNKGAGPWNSQELVWEFEKLGAHRGHAAGLEASTFSCAVLGENLDKVIELYGKMLLEPRLPDEELENVKQLALVELKALEDEPSSKVMVELSKQFYPFPFGRCHLGTISGVQAITPEILRSRYDNDFVADRVIIAVAGNFDWESVKQLVEKSFGGWTGSREKLARGSLSKESSSHHLSQDTSQLQIALAYPSVPIGHKDYYGAKVAVGVLSGGMSGRLFIEVREKRGLVYRVSASHSGSVGRAAVMAYAGTTAENAEETLDVMVSELRKLRKGVSDDELKRSKADLKSKLVIQLELSSARASRLVNDWWNLGYIRSLESVKSGIDCVTAQGLKDHLDTYQVSPITLVTLGTKALELPQ